MPAATPLQRTILHALGGACKWAILGKYSFNAFSRGFVDVFLWGVLCSTLPTWHAATAEFTGYPTLLIYMLAAALIEVSLRAALHARYPALTAAENRYSTAWLRCITRPRAQHRPTASAQHHPPPTPSPPTHPPSPPFPPTARSHASSSFSCLSNAALSGTWPPPPTALSAESWWRSLTASSTCPQVPPLSLRVSRALFLTALLQILLRTCRSRFQLQFARPSAVQPPPSPPLK
jgi:hypothetical protein